MSISTCCPSCDSVEDEWVGYSSIVQRKNNQPFNQGRFAFAADVLKCLDCGHTWRYARTGKPITVKEYQEIED